MPNTLIDPHAFGLCSVACQEAGHCIDDGKTELLPEIKELIALQQAATDSGYADTSSP